MTNSTRLTPVRTSRPGRGPTPKTSPPPSPGAPRRTPSPIPSVLARTPRAHPPPPPSPATSSQPSRTDPALPPHDNSATRRPKRAVHEHQTRHSPAGYRSGARVRGWRTSGTEPPLRNEQIQTTTDGRRPTTGRWRGSASRRRWRAGGRLNGSPRRVGDGVVFEPPQEQSHAVAR